MSDRLFDDDPITSAFANQRQKALAAVDGMQPDALLSCPPVDLVEEVMDLHRIHPLIIEWDRRTVDSTEIVLEAGGTATGTRVTYFIPYSGSMGLFHLRPNSHRGEPPSGVVRPDELLLSYSGVSTEPSLVRKHFVKREAGVRQWVAWSDADVEAFNRDLHVEVQGRLALRIDNARADAELPAALGLPRHERPVGPRWDAVVRDLRAPQATSSRPILVGQGRPGRPAWTLEVYEGHIAEAIKAAPIPHTLAAVARHFRALDGVVGVSPDWLGRLQRRFRAQGPHLGA